MTKKTENNRVLGQNLLLVLALVFCCGSASNSLAAGPYKQPFTLLLAENVRPNPSWGFIKDQQELLEGSMRELEERDSAKPKNNSKQFKVVFHLKESEGDLTPFTPLQSLKNACRALKQYFT